MNVTITDVDALNIFWLCFARWVAILFQLPIFDHVSIPTLVKVLSSCIFTYAFYEVTGPSVARDLAYIGKENLMALSIYYLMVGLLIGYLVKTIMTVFTSAGTIINQQVGLSAINYFDYNNAQKVGPYEMLIHWILLLMILSSGALYPMLKGVLMSFSKLELNGGHLALWKPDFFMEFFKSVFTSAILLATPLLFTNFTINIVMGIISRVVPQMNILTVSFVVNIALGTFVFIVTSEEFFLTAFRIYLDSLGRWFEYMQ